MDPGAAAAGVMLPNQVIPVSNSQAQLTIPLHQRSLHEFDNFHTGVNGELLQRLHRLEANRELGADMGLWLWGERGQGKSHLLQATCQAVAGSGGRALYLPLDLLPADPAVLEGLDAHIIALDDVQAWLGDPILEAALMGLYQDRVQSGGRILYAALLSAQQSYFALADLGSRLRALPGFEVRPPGDVGLREVLSNAASLQGLVLTDGVLDFWLHRSSRSLPVLLEQLARLDAQALTEQRRVTIPLIKEVLAL